MLIRKRLLSLLILCLCVFLVPPERATGDEFTRGLIVKPDETAIGPKVSAPTLESSSSGVKLPSNGENAEISPSTLSGAKNVALVIGNSNYENASSLANPKNDAQDVAKMLKKMNFSVWTGLI